MITQQIRDDIIREHSVGEYATERQTLAEQAMTIGLTWANEQPKGFNEGSLSRAEVRQKRRQNRKLLRQHIEDNMPEPVGFIIPSFVLISILSSIISWVVSKILNEYF